MKLSWLKINQLFFVVAAMLACLSFVLPVVMINFLNKASSHESKSDFPAAIPKVEKKSYGGEGQAHLITQEMISKASAVPLHRMKPPIPAPPPQAVPAPIAVPVEVVLFRGSLVGIIRDSDPGFCYAVIKDPDNRIRLVAKGGRLNERSDSPTVQEVNAESVVIAYGDRTQILQLRGEP